MTHTFGHQLPFPNCQRRATMQLRTFIFFSRTSSTATTGPTATDRGLSISC